ncbi:hypothetical protein P7C70_g7708, partial [Phenoliferia sp. Uapishka_3]
MWQTWDTFRRHRSKARKAGRDTDCFTATPLIGHVPCLPHIKVDSDSELAGSENSGSTDGDDDDSSSNSASDEMEGVEARVGREGSEAEGENLGGHDEFDWGDFGQPDDFGESDVGRPFRSGGSIDAESTPHAKEGQRDANDNASVAASSENEWVHPQAEEGDLWDGRDEDSGEEADAEGEGEAGVRDRRAEDEIAQDHHHRPQADEEEPEEPDNQEDDDEELAKFMAGVDLVGLAKEQREREASPPAEWVDDDYGGGGNDFDDQEANDNGMMDDGDWDQYYFGPPAGDPEGGGHASDGEPALGEDEEDDEDDPMGDDDEGGGDGGDEGGLGGRDRSESPEEFAEGLGKTAPRLRRSPAVPFYPCEGPSRELSREDKVRLHFFEMAVEHSLGPKLIERIRWFLWQIGVQVEGLDSLHMLRQHAHRISRPEIQWYDHCPGHTTSGNPATKDWLFCEASVIVYVTEKKKIKQICGKPRYFPLNTPNLKGLRKNSQKLGQALPPLDKVPVAQHPHMSIGPFVDALYANPVHSADLLRANRASSEAARTDSDRITSFETAEIPRMLFHPVTGVAREDNMIISTTSDGADIYPQACPNQPVHAHIAAVRCASLTLMDHNLCYATDVNGPKKGPATLYMHPMVADLKKLEVPKRRFHAAKGGMVTSRGITALNCSDTVEQCELSATVGAAGVRPSMLSTTRGVWNLLQRTWQHPLRAFARDPSLEIEADEYDNRGDVRTVLDDLPDAVDDGFKKYKIKPRTLEHYEETNEKLETSTRAEFRVAVRLASGITGRSIFGSLGIFPIVYPNMFSLDDMHVTYSNNMPHFIVSMFGKSGTRLTARGKMVSTANHFLMARELQRTIHLQPTAHGQKVRGITHLNRLKAAETRSFLWFHLAPLFHGVFEKNQDMALVVAAIRSTRLTNHRVILRDAPYDRAHKSYAFTDEGLFEVPFANLIRAVEEFAIKREKLFVGRDYLYGGTCTPSMIRSLALPDMCRLWGAGMLATTQWALEGKIGDLKRLAKSRALPVKNMENNNINRNMMVLIRLRFDFAKYDPSVSADLRHDHPSLDSTTFLHKKEVNPKITDQEIDAMEAHLIEIGEAMEAGAVLTRWQRLKISNGEVIGSISRERGTELERIVVEDDDEDNWGEKERVGLRRATRFCKVRRSNAWLVAAGEGGTDRFGPTVYAPSRPSGSTSRRIP